MATFKVGQRVKYINTILNPQVPTGAEGAIVAIGHGACAIRVLFDLYRSSSGDWGVYDHSIVPLADPSADAWAADKVKRLELVYDKVTA